MSDHDGNRREHSLLCLAAIYAIHVVLFHVFLPPKLSVTKITLASKFDELPSIWMTHPLSDNKTKNSTYLIANVTQRMSYENSEILKKSFNEQSPKTMEAIAGQFPQQVSIQDLTGNHLCSGNVINKDWILTAAHCMYSYEKPLISNSIKVQAGDLRLSESSDFSQRSQVLKIYVHKYYDNDTMENDVALLQLKSSLSLDDSIVSAIRLRITEVPTSTYCNVADWKVGIPNKRKSDAHGNIDDALTYDGVTIMQRNVCGTIYYKEFKNPKGMICVKHMPGNRDTCMADSGAGLICERGLTGILLRKNCSSTPFLSLYTDIRHYVDWIQEITNLTTSYDGKSSDASMTSTVSRRNFSPAALGIFLGCLAFLLTFTDHERAKA